MSWRKFKFGVWENAPCYGCKDRKVGCRETCAAWLTYREKLDHKREKVNANEQEQTMVNDYEVKKTDRLNKIVKNRWRTL